LNWLHAGHSHSRQPRGGAAALPPGRGPHREAPGRRRPYRREDL